MVGFYAYADPTQDVRTDLDNELVGKCHGCPHLKLFDFECPLPQDARWYTRAEIISVLEHPLGTNLARREYKKLDENAQPEPSSNNTQTMQKADEQARDAPVDLPPFRVPPRTAIAGVLISDWAYGRAEGLAGTRLRGNL